MNPELSTVAAPAVIERRSRKSAAKLVGLLAIAVIGISACTSVPSARRVAEDIINTAVEDGDLTAAEGDCMIGRLDEYDDGELEDITKSEDAVGPGTPLDMFEADLAGCTTSG